MAYKQICITTENPLKILEFIKNTIINKYIKNEWDLLIGDHPQIYVCESSFDLPSVSDILILMDPQEKQLNSINKSCHKKVIIFNQEIKDACLILEDLNHGVFFCKKNKQFNKLFKSYEFIESII